MGDKSKNERNGAPFGNKLKIYFVCELSTYTYEDKMLRN